jgi:hypothetical protein
MKGKVIEILPIESGISKAQKEWKRQSFVIDNYDQYNPNVNFGVFGDKGVALLDGLEIDQEVNVHFNVSSRPWEKDGKKSWFTSVDCWRIEFVDALANENPATPPAITPEESDDLPF